MYIYRTIILFRLLYSLMKPLPAKRLRNLINNLTICLKKSLFWFKINQSTGFLIGRHYLNGEVNKTIRENNKSTFMYSLINE